MNKLIIIISVVILLTGCQKQIDAITAQSARQAKECRDLGGLPILSAWDGRLLDCIFKPEALNDKN